jgi:ABC-2 type transport system permease protein
VAEDAPHAGERVRRLVDRLVPLFVKELRQLTRNRRLVVMLIVPPTLQLILFGFALNPEVTDLRLGVVDESRSAESRTLVSAFTESLSFRAVAMYPSPAELGDAISAGDLDAGLVVPADYAKLRLRGETAEIQLLLDATNSNTAAIAGGYAGRIVNDLNLDARNAPRPPVTPRVTLLYNAGLENSWFITTGLIGALLVLVGSLVSAALMVREKETGTIEQLLMTPASATEVIVAKVSPLLILLTLDIGIALAVCRAVFGVPIRGSVALLVTAGMFCVLAGIGIGTFIATFTKSQQQAQLMSFFVNPPIALMSGLATPLEAMPEWMQSMTIVNPVRHFATISRGVLLKGVGLDILYPNLLALVTIALVLVGVSVWRFRKQLG